MVIFVFVRYLVRQHCCDWLLIISLNFPEKFVIVFNIVLEGRKGLEVFTNPHLEESLLSHPLLQFMQHFRSHLLETHHYLLDYHRQFDLPRQMTSV